MGRPDHTIPLLPRPYLICYAQCAFAAVGSRAQRQLPNFLEEGLADLPQPDSQRGCFHVDQVKGGANLALPRGVGPIAVEHTAQAHQRPIVGLPRAAPRRPSMPTGPALSAIDCVDQPDQANPGPHSTEVVGGDVGGIVSFVQDHCAVARQNGTFGIRPQLTPDRCVGEQDMVIDHQDFRVVHFSSRPMEEAFGEMRASGVKAHIRF